MSDARIQNVLWRPFNPDVSGKTGAPLAAPRWSYEWWARFESILKNALTRHAATVVRQPENIREGDSLQSTDLAVYAHRTMRDIECKTAYSYPRFANARRRLFYMLMHIPGWFHLDTKGWGADNSRVSTQFNLDRINPSEARLFVDVLRNHLVDGNLSKHVQPPPCDLKPSGYALHCLQMPKDYTITHHSDVSVEETLDGLCAWADRKRISLVIKPHPVGTPNSVQKILDRWGESDLRNVYRGNIHSAIRRARIVLVINSGTGFEALIHGKPVVTFGKCDYMRATFRGSLSDLDDAWEWSFTYNPEIQKQFILWYYRTHVFDVSDPKCPDRVSGVVKKTIDG